MNNRIVVLGAGESGTGSALLAKIKGFDVFVSDNGKIKDKYKEILNNHNIIWEEGKHTDSLITNATEIIKSPGISEKTDIMKSILSKNIPIISEIEFAGRYTKAKTICITGSNGKTTTTLLTYYILKESGLNVGLAGNVGNSFAMQVATQNFDYYVIELSSFQLDQTFTFKPDIAVMLNITPDHLDRYHYNFQEYIDSKYRITLNLSTNDHFIYCEDDLVTTNELKKRNINTNLMPFSIKNIAKGGYLINNELHLEFNNKQFTMLTEQLALKGSHNIYNSMAAGISSLILDIRNEKIRECLSNFKGVEHRLEPVIKVHDIMFINDSKATNMNSTWYALESMKTKTVLILGGVDKGNDYSEIETLVREKVRAIVCMGKDNSKIINYFKDIVETVDTNTLQEAVRSAYYLAHNGDTVLLSPACASFDLFENYEDRGRQFKNAVRNL